MEPITKQFCFRHPAGEDIYLFTLNNATGTSVGITNYGAIITSFEVTGIDGKRNDIVLGFDKVEDYLSPDYLENYAYFGAVIGRYGNRIKSGKFSLDGKEYTLEKNNGPDHLHGGPGGFDKKAWTVVDAIAEPEPCLKLRYVSPDGEEGYPGELVVNLDFTLTHKNELRYRFTARALQPTIVNLTHHSYFNLDNGEGNIDDHQIKIDASHILAQGNNYVTTGELIPVAGTAYDFRSMRRIGSQQGETPSFDQSFLIDQSNTGTPAAIAFSGQSRIQLSIFTTEPVVHFYTGNGVPEIKGKRNKMYSTRSGFCLETQVHPNAINIPGFPDTVLRPGEVYTTETVYRVDTVLPK